MYHRLKAPFPYFGGKRAVASEVWRRIGKTQMYVEPFFGSGAVMLARPGKPPFGVEVANDYDGNVCNFYRSVQKDPKAVFEYANFPVNHIELHSRREYIVENYGLVRERLINDVDFYDAKIAGFWAWCSSCWIGTGLVEKRLNVKKGDVCKIPELRKVKGIIALEDPLEHLERIQERLKKVRVVCGDWTRVMGGNWRISGNLTCGVFF